MDPIHIHTPSKWTLSTFLSQYTSVELPEYANEEEMKKGLLTAIHFGGGILIS